MPGRELEVMIRHDVTRDTPPELLRALAGAGYIARTGDVVFGYADGGVSIGRELSRSEAAKVMTHLSRCPHSPGGERVVLPDEQLARPLLRVVR